MKSCTLDSPKSVAAFMDAISMYTEYGLPISYDFFNRFKSGEMPLAIENYTQFNMLTAAAPEINGLWDMAPIPGILLEDGTIDRSVAGSGTACIMLKKTKNKKEGWEFIRWWTSNETQARFGIQLEALMGPAARYPTANLTAFAQLPWSKEQRNLLTTQWADVFEIPQVPGSYYTVRSVTNATRESIFVNRDPREAILEHVARINEEIRRKRREFGLEVS
jgi:ABC-type glycerol-3-phosphate transport system substrate-binding protein